MKETYIKLYRKILKSPVFMNEKLLKVWIWCLCKATHKEHEEIVGLQKLTVKRGQFVFGRKKASKELDIPETSVWRYIQTLKKYENLDIEPNTKFSVITIKNWDSYQIGERDVDSNMDNKWTTNGQQMDTNKNDKNDKNITADNDIANTFQILENCGFMIDAFTAETLTHWIEELSAEWVQEAIRRSAKQGARKLSYVESILRDWKMKGAIDESYGRDKEIKKSSSPAECGDYSDANGIRFD